MNRASLAAALVASLLFGYIMPAGASDELSAAQRGDDARLPDCNDGGDALCDHLLFARLLGDDGSSAAPLLVAAALDGVVTRAGRIEASPLPDLVTEEVLAYGRVEEERLLGSDDDEERLQAYLPFMREIGVDGVVAGSFADSTVAAGVPAPAMLEVLQALGAMIDLARDVRDGDRFYVRYEQNFTAAGAALDVGRVLWVELRTAAKGTLAIHRFHTRDGADRFWLANGQSATPPSMRMPLDVISISSGFGLRADPFDQPPSRPTAGTWRAMGGGRSHLRSLPTGGAHDVPKVNVATPLGASLGLSAYGASRSTTILRPYGTPRRGGSMFMHEGIDLVAPVGTPVYAAADGVVVGAAPNGGYGNWIRIDHTTRLATVYGHLDRFAPGIEAGASVVRGDLIGFVGSTGRSTGAHLHFELLSDGKAVNPVIHPETKRGQLRGVELEHFRKQVAQSMATRDREVAAAKSFDN